MASRNGFNNTAGRLPAFLKPFPEHIDAEDIEYLGVRGVLSLPPPLLQNAFIRAYAEYVYPFLPLIDLREFLVIVNDRDGRSGQVSLFLYHSIMLVGSAFLNADDFQATGGMTKREARKVLFQKARLLYDFNYETDPLVVTQSLLLMTYWQEEPSEYKDMGYWLGIAISLATSLGLHQDPEMADVPPSTRKLRKRIWWCCVMRDSIISLGMRKKLHISEEEFDVPQLQSSDLDIGILPYGNTIIPEANSFVRDVTMQKELAALCMSMIQLCRHINRVVTAQYIPLVRNNAQGHNTFEEALKLYPRTENNHEMVSKIDKELLDWIQTLPPICKPQPLSFLDWMQERRIVAINRAFLHMLYNTAVIALHRPQIVAKPDATTSASTDELSLARAREAAGRISKITLEFHELTLERYLPTTAVTAIVSGISINMIEMKRNPKRNHDDTWKTFLGFMRVLEALRESYYGAEWAVMFFTKVFGNQIAKAKAAELSGTPYLEGSAEGEGKLGHHPPNPAIHGQSQFAMPPSEDLPRAELATTPSDSTPSTASNQSFQHQFQGYQLDIGGQKAGSDGTTAFATHSSNWQSATEVEEYPTYLVQVLQLLNA